MIERTAVLAGKHGLHARPAADLVKLAGRFRSDIQLTKDDTTVDAKSIMGVMMLAAECGSELVVTVEGPDEAEAIEAVIQFLETDSE
ncbi:MAG: HPr family phosphocarrier protein [Candidatus Eisenbacteria bacterium]|nr:HPr family phosphocarrier protein [Candidatus Eisenbacteria bacterium]